MFKIIVACLSFFLIASTYANEKGIVACIDDHPPYQYLGEVPHGTHISALKVLAQQLNMRLTYIQSPNFARCVALLKSGGVDVIAGLNITEKREKFAFYAPFKLADKLSVITKKDITINTYSDFKGKLIGVPRGATYFAKFDNDTTLNKIAIQNERAGISLLLKERIDLIMSNPDLLDLNLTDIAKANLKVSSISLDDVRAKETYFGFSKKHKLNLSQDEIINTVKSAFKRGDFLSTTKVKE
ncbi:substrate-binding periplasmic protein [Thalassotalea atypica]|uniref:substrate-binding periplasmic protein n=1 Tax=Thalassotalea atypica TaxID=2054316 RepID=UPI00257224EF|nr:transporter substrate-binding domain-containing protein [Thalassotalea atypica]